MPSPCIRSYCLCGTKIIRLTTGKTTCPFCVKNKGDMIAKGLWRINLHQWCESFMNRETIELVPTKHGLQDIHIQSVIRGSGSCAADYIPCEVVTSDGKIFFVHPMIENGISPERIDREFRPILLIYAGGLPEWVL